MISTVERLSPAQVKLHIEVDTAAFEEAVQKAYLQQRGRINIQGFRRGKAPRKFIEGIYGPKAFYDDAIRAVIPNAYGVTVVEHKLNPIGEPDIAVDQAEPGLPLLLTITATVYPETVVGDISDITAERIPDNVDDDAVDQEIERVRADNARVSEVEDRPVRDDDLVTIDYDGTIDGEPFVGGEAEKEQLTIGSGSFVAGFEEQLVGMNTGEERDITITFPDDYYQEDLRGKQAVFHITLHAIHTRELPEMDDEFAKDVSENFDTLEEYRADVRAKLEKAARQNADNRYESDLLEAVIERTVTEAPEILVEDEAHAGLERQVRRIVGDKPEQVESAMKIFEQQDDVINQHREEARHRILIQLVSDALIKREGLEYDPDKDQSFYEEALKTASEGENMSEEAFMELVKTSERVKDRFHNYIARQKMIKFLKDTAGANARKEPSPAE